MLRFVLELNGRSVSPRVPRGGVPRDGAHVEVASVTASPIDPALLRPVLAPTLGESRTLPAEAYLSEQGSGDYRIASSNPYISCVPLDEVTGYKLVYESSTLVDSGHTRVPGVKIFKYLNLPSFLPTLPLLEEP